MFTDERDKGDRRDLFAPHLIPFAHPALKNLARPMTHRKDQSPAIGKLTFERARHSRRSGGDDDPIVGGMLGQAA